MGKKAQVWEGGEGGRESLLLSKYILYPDSWRRLRFLLPVAPTMVYLEGWFWLAVRFFSEFIIDLLLLLVLRLTENSSDIADIVPKEGWRQYSYSLIRAVGGNCPLDQAALSGTS